MNASFSSGVLPIRRCSAYLERHGHIDPHRGPLSAGGMEQIQPPREFLAPLSLIRAANLSPCIQHKTTERRTVIKRIHAQISFAKPIKPHRARVQL